MHNLALELASKGHIVSGSDDQIFDPARTRLAAHGLLPEAMGWFPGKINKDIDLVILGMHARERRGYRDDVDGSGVVGVEAERLALLRPRHRRRAGSHDDQCPARAFSAKSSARGSVPAVSAARVSTAA